jgi:hypothetical protein
MNSKRLRPKTYSVAVYLVIGIIALQVVMVISVFWLRAMVVSVGVSLPKPGGLSAQNLKPTHGAPADFPTLPGLSPSHIGLLHLPTASDELAQVDTLNDEAQIFIKQSDFPSALDLLVRAEDIDPRYPTTLKNLAETYNMMNDAVRSKIFWQRLVDLGPGLDTLYATALDHVLLLNSGSNASPLKEPSTLARQIYIDGVEKSPMETRDGAAQFRVRTVLRRKDSNMPSFDQKKLQPYVIFYQQMPDGSLTPDLSQRKGSFDDTFLFWGEKTREPFGVDYLMPIPGMPGPNGAPQGKYYGFVIGIYYDKVLQDVRSEPSDLSTRMSLPQEIE